jgi:hypothetical protein
MPLTPIPNFNDPNYLIPNTNNYLTDSYILNQNYQTLSNQINTFNQLKDEMNAKNDIYDYSGNTLHLPHNRPPTILDGANDDSKMLILQENTVYIIGCITMATFLLLGLMIGGSKDE